MDYQLITPIEINGRTISAVALRPLRARDMVELSEHIAVLSSLKPGAVPDRNTFAAMIAFAGTVTGLGEAAGELDLHDLMQIILLAAMPRVASAAPSAPSGTPAPANRHQRRRAAAPTH